MNITEMLNTIDEKIGKDDFQNAYNTLQSFVADHPDQIDDRFLSECRLIEHYLDCRSSLKDWSYFYTIKLVYQYCEKKYCNEQICREKADSSASLPLSGNIWWCWLQGYDNAPDIIKACYRSLQKTGRPVIIITSDNLSEYVQLPDYILTKWKAGTINNTHFSDLLRLELLTTLGGTWIDSTVFCSDAGLLNEILSQYPLFCYSFFMRDSINDYILGDSWLLHAGRPSQILTDTKSMLYAYHRQEDRLMHYFLFHIIFSIACRQNPEEYRKIPIFSPEPCHVLQKEMLQPYDPLRYSHILKMSGIHKLTYKYDLSQKTDGTMLAHVLHSVV